MKKKILLLASVLLFVFGIKAQTNIPAIISSSQVWDLNGSPYILNQNTYIDTGVVIRVKPGVEIKSTGTYVISVNGDFQAVGKWDSIIHINKVEFAFSNKSKDYNKNTGKGACFI